MGVKSSSRFIRGMETVLNALTLVNLTKNILSHLCIPFSGNDRSEVLDSFWSLRKTVLSFSVNTLMKLFAIEEADDSYANSLILFQRINEWMHLFTVVEFCEKTMYSLIVFMVRREFEIWWRWIKSQEKIMFCISKVPNEVGPVSPQDVA